MLYTDLDRLHAVVSMENPGRGAGQTFADCHTVAGVLETTSEDGIICVVPKYQRVHHIMRNLMFKVFMDHDIKFHQTISQTQFVLFLPREIKKYILFVIQDDDTLESLALIGHVWPVVKFAEYKLERGVGN